MNYFEFFGLPVSFRVDESALRRQYLQNSKKYHPDFHTLSSESEQAEMLERSTLNNDAFKTLSDFDLRIRYILELKGLLAPSGGKKEEDTQPSLTQEFLMEMMDINESLMELDFDSDASRYALTLKAVENFEQEIEEGARPILGTWKEDDRAEPLYAVRDYFWKKKYLLRIRENLSKFAPA